MARRNTLTLSDWELLALEVALAQATGIEEISKQTLLSKLAQLGTAHATRKRDRRE